MKPRVMSLVLFTCMVGMLVAPNKISFASSLISLFAVALGAGAAGTLNMWYEADLDAVMSRTCLRPIPVGKVKKTSFNFWYNVKYYINQSFVFKLKFIVSFIISSNN